MRNYLTLIILTAIFFTSCKDVTQKSEKDTIILPDTTGFYAARNLKGLGVFIIGKSTYLNTLKNLKNEWRKNKRYDYFNYGKGLGESFSGLLEIKNDTTKTFQDNSLFSIHCLACKDTKAIGLYDYYIGDIEINHLLLTFYKDTLIRIDCDQNVKIDIGFVQKYGSGRVKEETIWDTPFGQTDKRPNENFIENGKAVILSIHNEKIWQNQKLKATSYIHISYKYKDKKYLGVDYSIRNFSIVSKDESKNNEMLKCDSINQSLYKTHRELKNKENLNKL